MTPAFTYTMVRKISVRELDRLFRGNVKRNLRRCPFCGALEDYPALDEPYGFAFNIYKIDIDEWRKDNEEHRIRFCVGCSFCGTMGPWETTEERAIKAWCYQKTMLYTDVSDTLKKTNIDFMVTGEIWSRWGDQWACGRVHDGDIENAITDAMIGNGWRKPLSMPADPIPEPHIVDPIIKGIIEEALKENEK